MAQYIYIINGTDFSLRSRRIRRGELENDDGAFSSSQRQIIFAVQSGNGRIIHWPEHNSVPARAFDYSATGFFIETNYKPGWPPYAREVPLDSFR